MKYIIKNHKSLYFNGNPAFFFKKIVIISNNILLNVGGTLSSYTKISKYQFYYFCQIFMNPYFKFLF